MKITKEKMKNGGLKIMATLTYLDSRDKEVTTTAHMNFYTEKQCEEMLAKDLDKLVKGVEETKKIQAEMKEARKLKNK